MFTAALQASVVCCEELEIRRLFAGFTLTPLAALDDTIGRSDQSAPVVDSNGDVYGLTSAGGTNSDGTVFELPAELHSVSVVHAFTPGSDPSTSYGSLDIDAANNVYGTSYAGGTSQSGSVFQITPGGAYNTVYNFPAAPGIGTNLLGELTLYTPTTAPGATPALDFFGASSMGGDSDAGTVFEVTDGASVTGQALVSFPANYGVIGSGVTRDGSGDIFGTSTSGGTDNAGSIWEVPAGGGLFFMRASFTGPNGSNPLGPMLWDSQDGVLYGTTRFGGANNDGTIFAFFKGVITTLASFDGVDGQDPQGNLYQDASGDLYGTTVEGGLGNLGSVFELPAGSSTIVSVASFDGIHNGSAPIGGLASDGHGNLFGVTSAGGANSDGVIYELSPLPAAQLVFATLPSTGVTGTPLSVITVDVEDVDGDIVTSDNSAVTLTQTSGTAGSLSGVLTVNAVDGVATFNDAVFTIAGDYNITASDGSLIPAASNSISVGLPPTHLVFATEPAPGLVNAVLPTVVVGVENANLDLSGGDDSTITLSIQSGPAGAVLGGTTTQQAVNGLASFSNLTVSGGGPVTLLATDGSLTAAVSNSFAVSPPAAHLMFFRQPANLNAGVRGTSPIVVEIMSADNTVETTARAITINLLVNEPNGRVARVSAVARQGVATLGALTFRAAGAYFLRASAGTLVAENSQVFTVSPGVAHSMVVITSPPLVATLNTPFDVQAKLVDVYGNIATANNSAVTIALANQKQLALLAGDLTEDAVDGIVTFSDLTIDRNGKPYVLRLVDGKLHTNSRPFAVR